MHYQAPRIEDYGSLVDMTNDQYLMHHFGIAAAAATVPVTPGGGGDILPAGTADTPAAAAPAAVGPESGEAAGPGASGDGPGAPGDEGGRAADPSGVTGAPSAGAADGQGVGAADELPFTGLNVAATAAAGAASIAAGLGLREATRREARAPKRH